MSSPGQNKVLTFVGGYFSADLKSFLSHSLNMHFPKNMQTKLYDNAILILEEEKQGTVGEFSENNFKMS
jgi:hypothetical protein